MADRRGAAGRRSRRGPAAVRRPATPAAAARLRPSTAAAARLTSAMRRRASRMTSASPMISDAGVAQRRDGVQHAVPKHGDRGQHRGAREEKRRRIDRARHLVARQEQRVADPRQQRRENQNRGTLPIQVRRLHGLRHQNRDAGDQRRVGERDVGPEAGAAAHQHRRRCPGLRAGDRPRTSGAIRRSRPAPEGRPIPCQSRRRRAESPATSRATKSRMNPAQATGIISTPTYFTFSARIFPAALAALSSQAYAAHHTARATSSTAYHNAPRTRRCRMAYSASGSRMAGATISGSSRGGIWGSLELSPCRVCARRTTTQEACSGRGQLSRRAPVV